jgi:hypothetical protein
MARAVAISVLLAGSVIGCSTGSDDRCLSAFRSVEPRALPAEGTSPLDDAVRSCGSVAAWMAAWAAVPSAHEARDDALTFLAGRCAVASLASTSICREIATRS